MATKIIVKLLCNHYLQKLVEAVLNNDYFIVKLTKCYTDINNNFQLGVAKHGKDFQTISKLLSDKTEAQVRTYFNTHKKSLFEQSLNEFNKKKKVSFV